MAQLRLNLFGFRTNFRHGMSKSMPGGVYLARSQVLFADERNPIMCKRLSLIAIVERYPYWRVCMVILCDLSEGHVIPGFKIPDENACNIRLKLVNHRLVAFCAPPGNNKR